MDQASYVFPSGEPGRLNLQASSQLVTMLNWAMSPHVKRLNMAFVMVDEKLADVSDRLDRQPARRDDRGAAAGREGARRRSSARRPATAALDGVLGFRRGAARDAHRRHLAHRSQRAAPVGARERQAPRRRRCSGRSRSGCSSGSAAGCSSSSSRAGRSTPSSATRPRRRGCARTRRC